MNGEYWAERAGIELGVIATKGSKGILSRNVMRVIE